MRVYLGRSIPEASFSASVKALSWERALILEIAKVMWLQGGEWWEWSQRGGKEVVLWLFCGARCETISGFGQNSDMVTYGHSGCYVTNRLGPRGWKQGVALTNLDPITKKENIHLKFQNRSLDLHLNNI